MGLKVNRHTLPRCAVSPPQEPLTVCTETAVQSANRICSSRSKARITDYRGERTIPTRADKHRDNMITIVFKVTVILLFAAAGADAEIYRTKPDFVKTCFKKDPEFDNCSREAVQGLFKAMGSGLPEIGMEPLDPLRIPKIRILQGEGPVNVNAALDDVIVTGFGNTEVLVSQVDGKTYDFFTRVRVPKLRIEGTYDLRGKILLVPLVGRGSCWFQPTNLVIDIVSDVKLYEKENFTFFNVTGAHVKFSIGGLTLRMNNLFDGIKALEENTNAYLNANWRPVSESLRPILSKTIEDILLGLLQQLFHNLPANYMVGDIKINNVNTIKKV